MATVKMILKIDASINSQRINGHPTQKAGIQNLHYVENPGGAYAFGYFFAFSGLEKILLMLYDGYGRTKHIAQGGIYYGKEGNDAQ